MPALQPGALISSAAGTLDFVMTFLQLPYASGAEYFLRIRELGAAAWLDSGPPGITRGRYDIITAAPRSRVLRQGITTQLLRANETATSEDDPLEVLATELAKLPGHRGNELPFSAGALGYFGYELLAGDHGITSWHQPSVPPSMNVGIYDWALVLDHHHRQARVSFLEDVSEDRQRAIMALLCRGEFQKPDAQFEVGELRADMSYEDYRARVQSILDYIQAGDCYQVNFAQRFTATFMGDPFAAYLALREASPAPYSAYLETEQAAVLCHSPEQFLTVDSGHVLSQPIKGTRPRYENQEKDAAAAAELLSSAKDRAENVMIVDLLRNDLSKNCLPHSVEVPKLFELHSFSNVHHLISTVKGVLKPGTSPLKVLRDCFPGGSITGAPKRRAMEIIRELEPTPRSLYCGSVGYINTEGRMDCNIAIRSLLCAGGEIACWGGGGIVADSNVGDEYEESLAKVRNLLQTLARHSRRN